MKKLILTCLILILGAAVVPADTIITTPGGGLWTDGASWIGGIVPSPWDDVVIASTILVPGTVECLGLTVSATGLLKSANSGYGTLVAGGSAFNEGTIQDGVFWIGSSDFCVGSSSS